MERRKAERRHLEQIVACSQREGFRVGFGGGERRRMAWSGVGREGERGEKSMEEVTNILLSV
jgi:hypothetical protein